MNTRQYLTSSSRASGSLTVSSLCVQCGVVLTEVFTTATLSWNIVQAQIPVVNFVHQYEHVFALKYVYTDMSGS